MTLNHSGIWTGIAGACALVLAGCVSVLPETEPNTVYRLARTQSIVTEQAGRPAMTVLIDRISAPRGLAGARIALQNDDAIAYMANAVWISPAPSMLESLIGQVIDAEAPILASARAEDGLETQYELDLLLRNFEAVYDQGDNRAPLARVAIQARLIDRDARELIATREFTSSRRAGDNRQGAIVDAFSEASTQNAFELADWLTSNLCERNRQIEACS